LAFLLNLRTWFDASAARDAVVKSRISGLYQLAEYVGDQARLRAPFLTGKLRESIQVIHEADGMAHYVIATAPYAEPQEFGFIHWISGEFIPGRAYMRRALRDGELAMPRFFGGEEVRRGFHEGRVMGVEFHV
jgi:hypothetical protein